MNTYFPVTCDIITPGHLLCFEQLLKKGGLIVGVLSDRALKGYKKNLVPFNDRFYVVQQIGLGMGFLAVKQDSLNPEYNILKHRYVTALASGDGFEKGELATIKKYGLKKVNVRLRGEKGKRWATSAIIKKAKSL